MALPFEDRESQLRGASARTQRRNAQRQRTMVGHPSNLPAGGEGQLFGTGPFTAPPKARPIPNEPQAAQQQQLPFRDTISVPGETDGFAKSGFGKYVRNNNGLQFNKPAIKHAVMSGVQAYSEAQYFSHSGFGAALRHTLGMPQMPSHMNDYLRSRHNARTVGEDPHSISAQFAEPDPDEYSHFHGSGLSW